MSCYAQGFKTQGPTKVKEEILYYQKVPTCLQPYKDEIRLYQGNPTGRVVLNGHPIDLATALDEDVLYFIDFCAQPNEHRFCSTAWIFKVLYYISSQILKIIFL